jgi:hypothetical protein
MLGDDFTVRLAHAHALSLLERGDLPALEGSFDAKNAQSKSCVAMIYLLGVAAELITPGEEYDLRVIGQQLLAIVRKDRENVSH